MLKAKRYQIDTTPALTAKHAFCVQYLTSHDHPQRRASMLDTSCLKFLPLPSCTTPSSAFPPLFLLMISTIVSYLPLVIFLFYFVLFCCKRVS